MNRTHLHQQLCPASHTLRARSLTSTDELQRSLLIPFVPFPEIKAITVGYHREQSRSIVGVRLPQRTESCSKTQMQTRRGNCPWDSASTLVQGRESSPPGKALPTAQISRQSSGGSPAGDLSSVHSHSWAGVAVPSTGPGTCWGARHRTAHPPRNAQPEEKGQCGGGSLCWKFMAWCHFKLLQSLKL